MTQQIINLGTNPNDGTGDVMRVAFTKVDNNFSELYSTTANITSNLSNLSSSVNIFEGQILAETGRAFDTANAAFTFANNQYTAMNAAFTMANTVNSLFYGAAVNAAAAFNMANSTVIRTNNLYSLTNASFTVANAAYNYANSLPLSSAITSAAAAYGQANLAFQLAGQAFDMANVDYSYVIGAISNVTSAYNFANGVSANTTSSYRVVNSAYTVANANYGVTNSVYYMANSAYATVNAAYNYANTKVNTVNGIVTGVFTVQGNQVVQGQAKFQGPQNYLEIIDGVIYINGVQFVPTPVGQVIYTASQSVPAGYLAADGSAVSRQTYAELFAAISTTFGPGNGSTTFNLPDLRGVFPRGWDNGRGLDSGRTFGSYQGDLFAAHAHDITDPGHSHTFHYENVGGSFPFHGGNGPEAYGYESTQTSTTGISVNSTGGAETRPKNVALLACIKY
jgi:microcystin-dependent protein